MRGSPWTCPGAGDGAALAAVDGGRRFAKVVRGERGADERVPALEQLANAHDPQFFEVVAKLQAQSNVL